MKILHRVCKAICSMLPMMASSKVGIQEGNCSQVIHGTAFRERSKACRARWYSGAGTAFGQFKVQITAHCRSGLYGRLSARQGWICPHWNPQRGRTVPPHTRNCPTAHGAVGSAMPSMVRLAVLILITPIFSGIPCCTGPLLVQVAMNHVDIISCPLP